jgi:transcriptional regulator with XRE-family HTH domain
MLSLMSKTTLPLPVRRALRKLGADIRDARRRRRIPAALLAERAMTSHVTLSRLERGDPGVSLRVYATVLFALGLLDRLEMTADAGADVVGLTLEGERLPKRVRRRKDPGAGPGETPR